MLTPGLYDYIDPIGGPPQRIQVREDDGQLVARFESIEGDDEAADVPIADMAGEFKGPLPAQV
jgi:hypothetical protein